MEIRNDKYDRCPQVGVRDGEGRSDGKGGRAQQNAGGPSQTRQGSSGTRSRGAEAARVRKLAAPIPFTGSAAGIAFGTNIDDGSDFIVPAKRLQHTLISGVAGSEKSILEHLLINQFVQSPDVKRLTLINLKGGIEFDSYRESSDVRAVRRFAVVVRVIHELMPFMERRQDEMRRRS